MKPIIGVMPLWDDEKDSIWMLPGYMDGVAQAGGTPVIFPFSEDENELAGLVSLCGGILFTGGHDVDPQLYGEEKLEGLVTCCPKRDVMEKIVLEMALRADKPVLGICRGIQFINAALGGTLYQDLPLQHPSEIRHRQQLPFDVPAHEVSLPAGSPLCKYLGADKISVNSYHHQAVRDPARGLEVMAVSPDGLIEALYAPDQKYLWAVQWHPEFSYKTDENSRKIFQSFVSAAG
ncbi:MAG: gamma-glutamyl-gamma-aminobutyrate hydrolase family protein [Eubacteriales bacterium]|nr:gamma-glutamyl-gamma-aminobutyrate hydrolase family protein [Eubacteriales bacterium]